MSIIHNIIKGLFFLVSSHAQVRSAVAAKIAAECILFVFHNILKTCGCVHIK